MSELRHAESFRELAVYRKARSVSGDIFRLSKSFPVEERYVLTNQVRRASRSVGAQIAEAWAKRRYERHFVSKLTDADAEQQETQHWVETAAESGYMSDGDASRLLAELGEIGRMISSMIRKAELFCGTTADRVHEDAAEYIVGDDQHRSLMTED